MSSATENVVANEHYREKIALGSCLMETLDDLIQMNKITPNLAHKILSTYDVVVADVLAHDVTTTLQAKAHLHTYNHADDVLRLVISGKLTLQHGIGQTETLQVHKLPIIAMRALDASTPSQRAGV